MPALIATRIHVLQGEVRRQREGLQGCFPLTPPCACTLPLDCTSVRASKHAAARAAAFSSLMHAAQMSLPHPWHAQLAAAAVQRLQGGPATGTPGRLALQAQPGARCCSKLCSVALSASFPAPLLQRARSPVQMAAAGAGLRLTSLSHGPLQLSLQHHVDQVCIDSSTAALPKPALGFPAECLPSAAKQLCRGLPSSLCACGGAAPKAPSSP